MALLSQYNRSSDNTYVWEYVIFQTGALHSRRHEAKCEQKSGAHPIYCTLGDLEILRRSRRNSRKGQPLSGS